MATFYKEQTMSKFINKYNEFFLVSLMIEHGYIPYGICLEYINESIVQDKILHENIKKAKQHSLHLLCHLSLLRFDW